MYWFGFRFYFYMAAGRITDERLRSSTSATKKNIAPEMLTMTSSPPSIAFAVTRAGSGNYDVIFDCKSPPLTSRFQFTARVRNGVRVRIRVSARPPSPSHLSRRCDATERVVGREVQL